MEETPAQSTRTSAARKLIPYAIMVVLLGCSVAAWRFWTDTAHRREVARFQESVDDATRRISQSMNRCAQLLQGGAALFAASDEVTRAEWREYYEYRKVRTEFPGLLYVVFTVVIPPPDLARHLVAVRAEGFSDYRVWPEGERGIYAPVVMLEPSDPAGRRALGFDMASSPVRWAAMERARDTGEVSISGRVDLVTEPRVGGQAGFLMYVPVYDRGKPLDSVKERRAALTGFVCSPFRAGDLMRSIFPEATLDIDFHVYDGLDTSAAALLYDRDDHLGAEKERGRPSLYDQEVLDLYGHPWTLTFETFPSYDRTVDRWTSRGILGAGLLISLLTFLFVKALVETRERAFDLAKEMTAALRQSERTFRAVTESAKDAILMIDQEARISYWNPAAERMFGYRSSEAVGRSVRDLGASERARGVFDRVFPEFVRVGQGGGAGTTMELTGLRRNGEEFPIEVSFAGFHAEDRWHAVAAIQDITERKRAEGERVAREAAEEASRAKSAFVANMSHEIRTPLNAILGFTQILERDPSLTPQQAEKVRTISRSGAHLLRLINDILDMSRIESGRTSLNESPFSLHDLLDDLEVMFRSRAEAKGLQFLADRDETVPRCVTADEGKLRQVMINLLGNAVKFTESGGVAVRVRAEAAEGPESLRLVAEVEDTGPGIPEGDLGRIFEPFQQSEGGFRAGGTGLGLAISRRFVEMMGGGLAVTSEPGRGTRFHFDVVLKPAEELNEREKPPARRVVGLEPGSGPFRILVVDDVSTNRALLVQILQPLGFEVAEAGNGAEALEVFERWSPHAVLMDMRMPIMDGYEATQRIKSSETGRGTPVIAVTASAFDDYREKVMAVGVDAYLRKPFRSEELLDVLGRSLGITYVYADDGPPTQRAPHLPLLTARALASVPAELIQGMRRAVEEGDMARLAEWIGRVAEVDRGVARGLQALADRYDYDALNQWLKEGEGAP